MLMLIPGPVQTRPEVRAAMADDIAPWDDEFRAEYAAIRERVREIAGGVAGKHATLPLQGCGHFIVEASLRTFIPLGGKVLVPVNGQYGERIVKLATEAGRIAVPMMLGDKAPVSPEAIKAALEADPEISHVALVVSETGSGLINDPNILGPVIHAAGRRMICDAVSAFGAWPFRMDEHPECDAVVFTSNKCLEGLPGLGFAISPIDRLEACQGQAGSWALDLSDIYFHALKNGWGSYRFTPPAQVLRAFGVALDLYDAEGGQPARLARYARNAAVLRDGLVALGFTPYLADEHQGPIIVNVRLPADPNFEFFGFIKALKSRGVLISNYTTTLDGPSLRIAAIGALEEQDIRFALGKIGETLEAMGIGRRAAA
ncbi:2-aminoethylphosphonate--pyruvate transaminase [Acetobacteraceae bacterium H6797]|nr:2-aminoethylphosphonate--pyruvate transaminase [Acetobacteraceae bacterium H6797]